MEHVPVGVADYLHFDVPRPFDIALDDDRVVAERTVCFGPSFGERRRELISSASDTYALAAATRGRFDEDRVADPIRGSREVGVVSRFGEARDEWHTGGFGNVSGVDLGTHLRDHGRGRANPRQARVDDRAGEVRVLGQEPEARVHGVAARTLRGLDNRGRIEITRNEFDVAVQQRPG